VTGDIAAQGINTFVIGFGALPGDAADVMDQMAVASGVPCTDSSCNGHQFYAAEDQDGLNAVIDAISTKIAGEFGGACDDSCYANGCDDGQACVQGTCKTNPCAGVSTCAPGSYCYWDGVSAEGTCKKSCKNPCGADEICNNGVCTDDPCSLISCDGDKVCRDGSCVTNKCLQDGGCSVGLLCLGGECKDDLCRYVTCPTGTRCKNGTGTCVAGGTGGSNGGGGGKGNGRASVGCAAAASNQLDVFGFVLALGVGAFVLRRRRPQRG